MSQVTDEHAVLVQLFREAPDLIARLVPGLAPTPGEAVTLTSEAVPQRRLPQHTSDLVLRYGPVDAPTRIIAVEPQRDPRASLRRFARYAATLADEFDCQASVLVVTLSPAVAEWARTPLPLDPLNTFRCYVLGPGGIPAVERRALAVEHPRLAVLSALAHKEGRVGGRVAANALWATARFDRDHRVVYHDLILRDLDAVAAAMLEELMDWSTFEFKSPTYHRGVEKGRNEGRELGRNEGRELGRNEGLELGRAEAARALLLHTLSARGFEVPPELQARLEACTEGATLQRWAERAITAAEVEAIFEDA